MSSSVRISATVVILLTLLGVVIAAERLTRTTTHVGPHKIMSHHHRQLVPVSPSEDLFKMRVAIQMVNYCNSSDVMLVDNDATFMINGSFAWNSSCTPVEPYSQSGCVMVPDPGSAVQGYPLAGQVSWYTEMNYWMLEFNYINGAGYAMITSSTAALTWWSHGIASGAGSKDTNVITIVGGEIKMSAPQLSNC